MYVPEVTRSTDARQNPRPLGGVEGSYRKWRNPYREAPPVRAGSFTFLDR